jgi:protein kinase C substrate 80K-H
MRLLTLAAAAAGAPLRGVGPAQEADYAQPTYTCGGLVVQATQINDDYCDCEDGSDEPGTSACSGVAKVDFFCPNAEAVPRYVYPSRVNDGVCDCCDGSDEWANPSLCKNICYEVGKKHREEVKARVEEITRALEKRTEVIERAPTLIASWKDELAAAETTVKDLEVEEAEFTKKLEEAEEALKAVTTPEPPSTEAPPPAEGDEAGEAPAVTDGEGGAEGGVSEYAKWMDSDGAGEVNAPPAAKDGDEGGVSEYAKWMDAKGAEEAGNEAATEDKTVVDKIKDIGSSAVEAVKSVFDSRSPEQKLVDDLKAQVDKTKEELRTKRDRRTELEEYLKTDWGKQNEWIDLHSKTCTEAHFGEYKYSICPYGQAKQGYTNLGEFHKFEDPTPRYPLIRMLFDNGDMCPGGPARSLSVEFDCGAEMKIRSVTEPSRCVYSAVVTHPAACDPASIEEYTKEKPKHAMEL